MTMTAMITVITTMLTAAMIMVTTVLITLTTIMIMMTTLLILIMTTTILKRTVIIINLVSRAFLRRGEGGVRKILASADHLIFKRPGKLSLIK